MKTAPRNHRTSARLLWLFAGLALAGCDELTPTDMSLPAHYHPANVYRSAESLDRSLKRVALLPLAPGSSADSLGTGVETLQPILRSEVEKTGRFEVVPISPELLRQWTGQSFWRTEETLPLDFFGKLRQSAGCDGVMFCQLTRFQAYQPLAAGWKLRLVEIMPWPGGEPPGQKPTMAPPTQTVWSAEDVFDAGVPRIGNAAHWYYKQNLRDDPALSDPAAILTSPVRFGQFSLSTLLATLPKR